jgi:hypothetical protein
LLDDHICQGHFTINGRVLAEEVGVGTQDAFMTLGALKERYFFTLNFFSPRVFLLGADSQRTKGMRYVLKGPAVASMDHGPLGHPGDGEYDRWECSDVEFTYRFYRNSLRVGICANSELGTPGSRNAREVLPVQELRIEFVVLRPRLSEFLRTTESAWTHFQNRLKTFPIETDA